MTQDRIETDRVSLTDEQHLMIQTLTATIKDQQARYGQVALAKSELRDQYESVLAKYEEECSDLRSSLLEASQGLREFSSRLTTEFEINLNDGHWSLNTEDGCFVQTKSHEDVSSSPSDAPDSE